MANLYVTAVPSTDLNRNTEWFTYPGVWTIYILILFFSWLTFLSLIGCSPGMAWTFVHLSHFMVTYHFFHWKKGTPFADDQGIYNTLTWWEQIDSGNQLTRNRKFLTVVPVVFYLKSCNRGYLFDGLDERDFEMFLFLVFFVPGIVPICFNSQRVYTFVWYLIASHTTDYQHPMLFLNSLAVFILVVAKFPNMHKVRIFGINAGQ